MVSWSGRKKALTIIAFIAPTLIGIVMFNIYPILFNVYISFTNRNQYHPNPNCEDTLSGIFEPSCWPMFKESSGVSQPYRLQDPVFQNYADLIGQLFSAPGMIAIGKFVLVFIPLILASQVNKYYDKRITRPVSSFVVWMAALVLAVLIAWLVDAPGAMNTLQATSDFFVVVFRTLLFVVITVPINYIFGLVLALVLNSNYIKGRTFFRAIMVIPWAASTMFIIMSLVWQFFFREQGTVNQILKAFNIESVSFLTNPT